MRRGADMRAVQRAVDFPAGDPFGLSGGKSRPPLGALREESATLCLLLSELAGCGRRCPEADVAVEDTFEALRLRRILSATDECGRTLYELLLEKGDELVNLVDLQGTFSFVFETTCDEFDREVDALYRRPFDHEVRASVVKFITDLDLACLSLPGLHDSQADMCFDEVRQARACLAYEIHVQLCSSSATNESLLTRVSDVSRRLVERSVQKHQQRLHSLLCAVQGVSKICRAVQNGDDDLSEVVQANWSFVREVCADGTRAFCAALARRGLNLSILQCCACTSSQSSFLGQSMLAPSIGRVVDMLEEFFCNQDVASRFQEACDETVSLLCAQKKMGGMSPASIALEICKSDAVATVTTTEASFAIRGPAHAAVETGLCMKSVSIEEPTGLRVSRLCFVVQELVRRGVLAVNVVKASVLLASVARTRSDLRFKAAKLGHGDVLRNNPIPATRRAATVFAAGVTPQLVSATVDEFDERVSNVPLSLLRDYHIIYAMQGVVCEGRSSLTGVAEKLREHGAYCEAQSTRSVQQSVAFVAKKCFAKFEASQTYFGEARLQTESSGSHGTTSIYCDRLGAFMLQKFLTSLRDAMRSGDPVFVKTWHASRSSRNRAKSCAASKQLDVPRK